MRALTLLVHQLEEDLQDVHDRRRNNVFAVTGSLLRGDRLSLTALGRTLAGPVQQRHKIKRVDRLLKNKHLHEELTVFYRAVAHRILEGVERPVVLVDWTEVGWGRQALVAAVAQDGRSIPIYAVVHPESDYADPVIERKFLEVLKDKIIPAHCHPVVVTDGGFRNPWFRSVLEQGWDFVGRLGKSIMLRKDDSSDWLKVRDLKLKYGVPRDLGMRTVTRRNPLSARVVAMKRRPKGRRADPRVNRKGVHPGSSSHKKQSSRAKQPWVLATSLEVGSKKEILALYGRRMCIEQAFRDEKSHRFGWTFEDARCKSSKRYEVLLLVAALAMFAVYLLGQAGELLGMQRRYQANTIRSRRVFSLVRLGRLLDQGGDHKLLRWRHISQSLLAMRAGAEALP